MPTINNISSKLAAYFATQPIDMAWVFGSVARGEETDASDLDILVRFTPNATITLFKYGDMRNAISKIACRDVDLVEYDRLKDFAKQSAERDKILIYERKN
jgi:uncharacterized protein